LREGVLVPDVYDATLNPLYRDVLAHYGAVALPCRIQDPDRSHFICSGAGLGRIPGNHRSARIWILTTASHSNQPKARRFQPDPERVRLLLGSMLCRVHALFR
jgi:hypothetical protein